jgi:hypothetical protein
MAGWRHAANGASSDPRPLDAARLVHADSAGIASPLHPLRAAVTGHPKLFDTEAGLCSQFGEQVDSDNFGA